MNTMLFNKEDAYVQDTAFICNELENSLIIPYFNIDGWKDREHLRICEKDIESKLKSILGKYCNKYDFLINTD